MKYLIIGLCAILLLIGCIDPFGITNPPSGGTCTGLNKLLYRDHLASPNGFEIVVENGDNGAITEISVEFKDRTGQITFTQDPKNSANPTEMEISETSAFTASSSSQLPSGNYVISATFKFRTPRGVIKTETATCTGLMA